jgi:hypothetical protein
VRRALNKLPDNQINKALYKGYHHLKFGAGLSDQTATGELDEFFDLCGFQQYLPWL